MRSSSASQAPRSTAALFGSLAVTTVSLLHSSANCLLQLPRYGLLPTSRCPLLTSAIGPMAPACSRKNCLRWSSESTVKKDLPVVRCAMIAFNLLAPFATLPSTVGGSVTGPCLREPSIVAITTTQQPYPTATAGTECPRKVSGLVQQP